MRKEGSGRPNTSVYDDMIETIDEIIRYYRKITVEAISRDPGNSIGSVHTLSRIGCTTKMPH